MQKEQRLIDANAFKMRLEEIRQEYLEEDTYSSNFAAEVIETVQDEYLANAPTVDAVEVVHGRWIFKNNPITDPKGYFIRIVCSECNLHTGQNLTTAPNVVQRWMVMVMAEYINREAVRNELYDADAITMRGVAILNNFPSADVVEVVRCKDCKYCYSFITKRNKQPMCRCMRHDLNVIVRTHDFCSYGERREGE